MDPSPPGSPTGSGDPRASPEPSAPVDPQLAQALQGGLHLQSHAVLRFSGEIAPRKAASKASATRDKFQDDEEHIATLCTPPSHIAEGDNVDVPYWTQVHKEGTEEMDAQLKVNQYFPAIVRKVLPLHVMITYKDTKPHNERGEYKTMRIPRALVRIGLARPHLHPFMGRNEAGQLLWQTCGDGSLFHADEDEPATLHVGLDADRVKRLNTQLEETRKQHANAWKKVTRGPRGGASHQNDASTPTVDYAAAIEHFGYRRELPWELGWVPLEEETPEHVKADLIEEGWQDVDNEYLGREVKFMLHHTPIRGILLAWKPRHFDDGEHGYAVIELKPDYYTGMYRRHTLRMKQIENSLRVKKRKSGGIVYAKPSQQRNPAVKSRVASLDVHAFRADLHSVLRGLTLQAVERATVPTLLNALPYGDAANGQQIQIAEDVLRTVQGAQHRQAAPRPPPSKRRKAGPKVVPDDAEFSLLSDSEGSPEPQRAASVSRSDDEPTSPLGNASPRDDEIKQLQRRIGKSDWALRQHKQVLKDVKRKCQQQEAAIRKHKEALDRLTIEMQGVQALYDAELKTSEEHRATIRRLENA
tara:strand:+ start:666 stop:2420 length:1755 start_codon:yes stop_codon:yes gene_type:complete